MVFAMVFTIIVMGLILVFGFDQIISIFNLGGQAQCQSVIKKIDKQVQSVYSYATGSGVPVKINIPDNCRICFVNSTDPSERMYTDKDKTWNPDIVYQKLIEEKGYNIWWEYSGNKGGYTIKHLAVKKSFCVKRNQKIYIENLGRSVGVS